MIELVGWLAVVYVIVSVGTALHEDYLKDKRNRHIKASLRDGVWDID